MKNFVVVVDTQYDFMMPDGILYVKGAEETIVPMAHYLSSLNAEKTAGVLFTFDTHVKEDYEGSPEAAMFPLHCELGTSGHANVLNPEFVDKEIELFSLRKQVFDMWSSEYSVERTAFWNPSYDVKDFFSNEFSEIEIIDIVGVALNFCVKQAADGFLARGHKVRLHTSMTRGIDTGKPGDLDARVLYADEIANGKVIVVD